MSSPPDVLVLAGVHFDDLTHLRGHAGSRSGVQAAAVSDA